MPAGKVSPLGTLALAAAGGMLAALSFPLGPPLPIPPVDGFWPAAWIALAPLIVAALRAPGPLAAARAGFVWGIVSFGLILCWLHPFLARWAMLSRLEAAAVTLLLVSYLSFYPAIFAACLRAASKRRGAAAACLLAPAAWTGLEWLRGTLLTGFPWCLLGYSQIPAPAVVQVADLAGVYAVSFTLACSGALAAAPFVRGAGRVAAIALAAAIVAAIGYGFVRIDSPASSGAEIRTALVQADVAQSDKWDPQERLRIEVDHVAMTKEAADAGARLVIWSESAVPASITHDPAYAARLEDLARRTEADLILGTVFYERRGAVEAPFNSAIIVRPDLGLSGRYDKIHLVPFGEYVPLKGYLFFLESLVAEASDFEPGRQVRLLEGRGARFGPLVCYEAIFPDLVRRFTRQGAEVLVNITNDAWYGDTAMPRQHLLHAVMRAVESRRPLLRCANTGISAVVEPSGRIAARTAVGDRAVLSATVRPAAGLTLYARWGDGFAILCAILAALALLPARVRPNPSSPGGDDGR